MCKDKQQQNFDGDKKTALIGVNMPADLKSEKIRMLSFELDVPLMVASWLYQMGYGCVDDLYYVSRRDLRDAVQAAGQSVSPAMLDHIVNRVDLIEKSAHQDKGIEGMLPHSDYHFRDLGSMQPAYEFPPAFSEAVDSSSLFVELGQSVCYAGTGVEGGQVLSQSNLAASNYFREAQRCIYSASGNDPDGSVSDLCTSTDGVYGGSLRSGIDFFGGDRMLSAERLSEGSLQDEESMAVNMRVMNQSEPFFVEGHTLDDGTHSVGMRDTKGKPSLFSLPVSPILSTNRFGLDEEAGCHDEVLSWSP